MYRFANQLSNANLVLVRKKLGDGSCAALVVMRAPVRQYAGETCPPPSKPPKKTHKIFWGAVGATVLTGAAVVYAKSSPDARNWLASNAPMADSFIAFVYQENTTYTKTAVNKFNQITTFLSHFLFGKEGVTPPEIKSQADVSPDKLAETAYDPKTYEPTLVQTEKCDPQSPAPIKITKDMVELEHDMHENTRIAVDNYKKATEHCTKYNKALFTIVESSIDDLESKHFKSLQAAQSERDKTLKVAKEAGAKARCAIETLDRMIKAGVQAPPESLAATSRYLKQFRADLEKVENACKVEYDKAVLADKYWNKVEEARLAYKNELQTLFPGVDLTAKTLDLRGDTDLLLIYTLKQVQFLQKELAEIQTIQETQVSRAVECHDAKDLIEAKADDKIKKDRIEKEREYQRKALEMQADSQRKLKEQLKKQFEIQQEVLQSRLKKKEEEMLAKFNRAVSEQVERERVIFKKDLAAMAGKLMAIERTLKERAKAEEEARKSQSLWAAAEALLAATRKPCPNTKVDSELSALDNAGKSDKLVQSVLKGIPADVKEKGIVTEKALKDRFEAVEKRARTVALVGREGAALPVYVLSWLQSKFMFNKLSEIPSDELNNLPTDFSTLDTFDIMQRAKYYMDRGDIAVALKYVNLLQGAPRAAAKNWVEDARRHLEIRQAAEAVMAHASASGLLYL